MLNEITISRILFAWITLLMSFTAIILYNDTNVQPHIRHGLKYMPQGWECVAVHHDYLLCAPQPYIESRTSDLTLP